MRQHDLVHCIVFYYSKIWLKLSLLGVEVLCTTSSDDLGLLSFNWIEFEMGQCIGLFKGLSIE